MAGLALSLGLEESYFADRCTGEPLTLFRIFNYPPPADPTLWGVGEHTDYGLLTILLQDDAGGLEVQSRSRWVAAPPVPGSFVCNIGDMLDRMTGGLYRSTPHRVRNPAPRDRLSFPFFFDPNFFARVRPIELPGRELPPDDRDERWDRASVHAFEGTYGDYLLGKVGKVFPGVAAGGAVGVRAPDTFLPLPSAPWWVTTTTTRLSPKTETGSLLIPAPLRSRTACPAPGRRDRVSMLEVASVVSPKTTGGEPCAGC